MANSIGVEASQLIETISNLFDIHGISRLL